MVSNTTLFLKNSKDFENIKTNGKKSNLSKLILVCYVANSLDSNRVGMTLPRNVGNAVVRNKLKRFVREFFRNECPSNSSKAYDFNFVFLKSGSSRFVNLKYVEFKNIITPFIDKLLK